MQVGQTCERGEVDAGLFDEALEGWGRGNKLLSARHGREDRVEEVVEVACDDADDLTKQGRIQRPRER